MEIVIFGTGDIARLANFYFKTDSQYKPVAFVVDRKYMEMSSFEGLPVVATDEVETKYPPGKYRMFIALSYAAMNKYREEKFNYFRSRDYSFVSYVSSRSSYLSQHPPGDNCFILEDNTIQPYVRIGNNVTLWSGNHIGHDSSIMDHTFVSSHVVVSGHCTVKTNCFLGVNATLRNSITIGDRTLIGAGSIIMHDTEADSVYVPQKTSSISKKSYEIKL